MAEVSARRRRGPARFRESEVRRVIRAARAVGAGIVEIDPEGCIRVIVTAEANAAEAKNPWDDNEA